MMVCALDRRVSPTPSFSSRSLSPPRNRHHPLLPPPHRPFCSPPLWAGQQGWPAEQIERSGEIWIRVFPDIVTGRQAR
eukprot:jgi/Botrbrau1/753/Bobra.0181s0012.1